MIYLDLQPEVEAELAAQALSQGLPIERYLEDMVTERLAEEGLRRGLEDIATGRTYSAHEVFAQFRERHGIQD